MLFRSTLAESKIKAAKEKANLLKAKELEKIRTEGKKLFTELSETKKALLEAHKKSKEIEVQKTKYQKQIDTLKMEKIPEMAQISLVEAKIKSANDKAQVKELELQEIAIETKLEVLRELLEIGRAHV